MQSQSSIIPVGNVDHVSHPPNAAVMLVTVDDTARRLSLSARSVWKLIAAGTLPVVRIGRSTRVRVTDLQKFIAGEVG